MGAQQSQDSPGQNSLDILLHRDFYMPGQTVYGSVQVTINGDEPVHPKQIQIGFEGNEKAICRVGDDIRIFSKKIFTFEGEPLEVGEKELRTGKYSFKFEFKLPINLPSSMNVAERTHHTRPTVRIKHSLAAKLVFQDHSFIQFKREVVVRESPIKMKENITLESTEAVRGCCGTDRGSTRFLGTLHKNVFFEDEALRVPVQVDNSLSQYALTGLEAQLLQVLRITDSRQGKGLSSKIDIKLFPLKASTDHAVGRHSGEVEEIMVKLELKKCLKEVAENIEQRKTPCSKPTLVARPQEDLFMLSRLSPSCHSEFVKNDYFLRVVAKYEGYTRPVPVFEEPISIVPRSDSDDERGQQKEQPGSDLLASRELGCLKLEVAQYVKNLPVGKKQIEIEEDTGLLEG